MAAIDGTLRGQAVERGVRAPQSSRWRPVHAVRTLAGIVCAVALASPDMSGARAAGANGGVDGVWRPESKALEGLGTMALTGSSLRWSICENASVQMEARANAGEAAVLNVGGAPGCRLDGQAVRHLRIKVREDGCKAEVSLYADPQAMASDEPLAWGVLSKAECKD